MPESGDPDLWARRKLRLSYRGKDGEEASIWTIDDYLGREEADAHLALGTRDDLGLTVEPKVYLYGQECISHRCVGFFSNVARSYRFAGQEALALPLIPELAAIQDRVNRDFGTRFNGVLVNLYRNGNDDIGTHADDERDLDRGVVVALSLGSSRTFRIHNLGTGARSYIIHNDDGSTKVTDSIWRKDQTIHDIEVQHGQLLVMDGCAQRVWKHEVPARKRIKVPRVSYTFRVHTQ